jgi:hypothetical protein
VNKPTLSICSNSGSISSTLCWTYSAILKGFNYQNKTINTRVADFFKTGNLTLNVRKKMSDG